MARGRKPKPQGIKDLEGNPGKRKKRKAPEIEKGSSKAPAWLTDRAKKYWTELEPHLTRAGVLTRVDGPILALFCDTYALMVDMRNYLQKNGYTYECDRKDGGTMTRLRPEYTVYKDARKDVRQQGEQLGITPSGRTRLDTDDGQLDLFENSPDGAALPDSLEDPTQRFIVH